MVYRIRYVRGDGRGEREAVVEANNTTEALVKFSHTHVALPRDSSHPAVTSVSPDLPWDDLLVETDFGSVS